MRLKKEPAVVRETLLPLTKQEIERRIEQVRKDVGAVLSDLADASTQGAASRRPRWIHPRALVERVRPFLVYN